MGRDDGEGPEGRQGGGTAWDGREQRMFVFGGRGGRGDANTYPRRRLLNDLWECRVDTRPEGNGAEWKLLCEGDDIGKADVWEGIHPTQIGDGTRPAVRHNHGLVYVPSAAVGSVVEGAEGALICLGGSTHFGYLDDLWVFDIGARVWISMSSSNKGPSPRHGCAVVYSEKDGCVYVVGGHTGIQSRASTVKYFGHVWSLDLSSWTWTLREAQLDPPRSWMGAVVVSSGLILLMGGYRFDVKSRTEVYYDAIEAYDPDGDVFVSLPPTLVLPSPRNRVCAAASGSTVFVMGGNALVQGRDVFYNDVQVLNVDGDPQDWEMMEFDASHLPGRGHSATIAWQTSRAPPDEAPGEDSGEPLSGLGVMVWGGERSRARLTDTIWFDFVRKG